MKNLKVLLYITIFSVVLSCENENIFNESPTSFEVETENLNFSTARIKWTESIDPENDKVYYNVLLENRLIKDSIYYSRNYTITNLNENSFYSGEVVANDSLGNQTKAVFSLRTFTFPYPSDFNISINSKNPIYSGVNWTKSTDTINREILYNVFLNDSLVAEKTNHLNFTFGELKGLTNYNGKIIAINPDEKTLTKTFSFTTEEKIFDGDVHLQSQDEVNEFAKRCYNVITGDLIIGNFPNNVSDNDITDISKLSDLIRIQGDRLIINKTKLDNINSLQKLTTTNENLILTITNNPLLKNLDGFIKIKSLYDVFVTSNNSLESVEGLQNLETVKFNVHINLNPNLKTLELKSLSNVRFLKIENNEKLRQLKGLENIKTLSSLYIIGLTLLENYRGLHNLKTVSDFVIVENNPINLIGFDSLEEAGSVSITDNENITSLEGLESLTKLNNISIARNDNLVYLTGIQNVNFNENYNVRHDIIISTNPKLLDLNPLENYKFRYGKISINFNSNLTDFCGLNNLFSVVSLENGFAWATNNGYNPSRNDMLNRKCRL
ncbi:hypothetical protein [Polaribacter sp. Asnod6-C07]|uniref:hypothetical protein n=1 Tax=Polaribacter sp. Asnod6-C07 TaxID=3160582 RepID=UPI00386A09CE